MKKLMLWLSVMGLLIALYLTLDYYLSIPVACPTGGIIDCGKVLHSPYSDPLGVPLAAIGLAFFIIETLVIVMGSAEAIVIFSALGVAGILYLVYLEYLIGAICLWCTADHIIGLTLFVLALRNK